MAAASGPDRRGEDVKNFVDGVEKRWPRAAVTRQCRCCCSKVSQILLAGAQLGASRDVILPGNWEPGVGDDPDLDALRTGLAARLSAVDEYAEVFDPYADTSCLPFRISDDIAAVVADLIHGLRHCQARPVARGAVVVAVLLRLQPLGHPRRSRPAVSLHAVVAHASLDVPEERASM